MDEFARKRCDEIEADVKLQREVKKYKDLTEFWKNKAINLQLQLNEKQKEDAGPKGNPAVWLHIKEELRRFNKAVTV